MQTLFVGIASWIIQDGNYGDFRVGQSETFALEFHPLSISAAQGHEAVCERISGCRHRVRGRVVYAGRRAWVIDFGVKAYQHRDPPRPAVKGAWIEGEISIGVDPFFYRDELRARAGMPELRYGWRIRSIQLETTPWVSVRDGEGRTVLSRDAQAESYVEVAETNAWEDDEGRAYYILECERIG